MKKRRTTKRTPWLGMGYRQETRPVQSSRPTAQQVAETVMQELRDPGYMVSFYDGDKIRTNDALRILAREVLKEKHCPNCECIHQPCGAVIGSAACVEFHDRNKK